MDKKQREKKKPKGRRRTTIDPITDITVGLKLLDILVGFIKTKQAEAGMTGDQIIAHADTLSLTNDASLKALLAL